MKIAVRKADGYVLNSDIFNSNFPSGDFDEAIYSREDYDVYEITDPQDEEKEFLIKRYFYRDGKMICTYYVSSEVDEIIQRCQEKLNNTDYIIVKTYEQSLVGNSPLSEYDYESIAKERQQLRNRINELRQLKVNHPFTSMYNEDYLKPI